MSLESKILSYSTTMRKVAFCHLLVKLYPMTLAERKALEPKYERFLNIMAPMNLIDDEIESYLDMETASTIVTAYVKSNGFIDAKDIAKCNMAMAMAMEYRLFGAWAAMDILFLKADYPIKIDLDDKNVIKTIDHKALRLTIGFNPTHKRAIALMDIIKNTIKSVG